MSTLPFLKFLTLDVFTSTPYTGNPLALVKVPSNLLLRQSQKQAIAREFNFSETVFVHESESNNESNKTTSTPEWRIDIFTPEQELPFAGHPTIGAACYVLKQLDLGETAVGEGESSNGTLLTKSGPIAISTLTTGWGCSADISHSVHIHRRTIGDLASTWTAVQDADIHALELAAPVVSIVAGMAFFMIELQSEEMLGRVRYSGIAGPDLKLCLDEGRWGRGFVGRHYYVLDSDSETGEGEGEVNVSTRMIDRNLEDPATGSAACTLGAYLALKRGASTRFRLTQGREMGRDSVIRVEVGVDGKGGVKSVRLVGKVVLVMEGSVRVPVK